MQEKEKRELYKQFNQELSELCKDGENFSRIEYLLDNGADIFYSNSRPMYWATKRRNFSLIRLLIAKGALEDRRTIKFIASICDYKGFTDKAEEEFFELIDLASGITGEEMEYFVPYINSMVIHGKIAKLETLSTRYKLDYEEMARYIYPRVIFEAINNAHYNSLEFINRYIDWMDAATLDMAVSSGETDVVVYMLENKPELDLPSEPAVIQAIFDGYTDILDFLIERGLKIADNPKYLAKACRSFYSNGPKALEYLLEHGYSLKDSYGGKTVYENAVFDQNTPLLEYLEENNGSKRLA